MWPVTKAVSTSTGSLWVSNMSDRSRVVVRDLTAQTCIEQARKCLENLRGHSLDRSGGRLPEPLQLRAAQARATAGRAASAARRTTTSRTLDSIRIAPSQTRLMNGLVLTSTAR